METFEAQIELSCSPETVFDFLIQPANIKAISPPGVGLFFVSAPERLELHSRMQFKLQAFGVAREATHEVTGFEPYARYVEEQVSGPMRSWVHEHLFEPTASGVIVIDRITFQPPGGVAGLLISKDRILENLDDGFYYRHQQIAKHLK
jgi:ligand-binding SRPBCC domain-containing protein